MDDHNDHKGWLDRPENVRALLLGFTAVGVVALLLDLFVHREVEMSWERVWGAFGFFGFIAVALLIQGAKLLRRMVMRDEDYYDVD